MQVDRDADPVTAAHELRVLVGQLVRRVRQQNALPVGQAAVMGHLDRQGPMTTSDLALAQRMRPQSMASTVGELDALGYVERRPHPTDGRRTLIALSEAGQAMLRDDRRRGEDWLAQAITAELSPAERATLVDALDLVRRVVES